MSDLSNVGHRVLITFLSDVSAEVARCIKDNLRATDQEPPFCHEDHTRMAL